MTKYKSGTLFQGQTNKSYFYILSKTANYRVSCGSNKLKTIQDHTDVNAKRIEYSQLPRGLKTKIKTTYPTLHQKLSSIKKKVCTHCKRTVW